MVFTNWLNFFNKKLAKVLFFKVSEAIFLGFLKNQSFQRVYASWVAPAITIAWTGKTMFCDCFFYKLKDFTILVRSFNYESDSNHWSVISNSVQANHDTSIIWRFLHHEIIIISDAIYFDIKTWTRFLTLVLNWSFDCSPLANLRWGSLL